MEHQISAYRQEIDVIDFQLLDSLAQHKKQETEQLLKKRLAVVKKLAVYKKEHHIPLFDPEREAFVFRTRKAYGTKIGLPEEEIKRFFFEVLRGSHNMIETIFQNKEI